MTKTQIMFGAAVFAAMLMGSVSGLGAMAAEGGPLPGEGLSQSYRESQMDNYEYQLVEPIKMADNLYYVGPGYVGVYLITTPEGHVLIDAAEDPYVPHVLNNIRKVGADPADIKYILISHGHLDHFGGVAAVQDLSNAQVGAVAEDWELIRERVNNGTGRNEGPPPRMPREDFVIEEGDTLEIGGNTFTFHVTPGHTAGVMSAEFTVYDNGTPHKAFFSGGTGGRPGLEEVAVESTSRVVEYQDIEVFLPNHAWNEGNPYPNGSIFERAQRIAPGQPNPFIDGAAWREWIDKSHQRNVDRWTQIQAEHEHDHATPQPQ